MRSNDDQVATKKKLKLSKAIESDSKSLVAVNSSNKIKKLATTTMKKSPQTQLVPAGTIVLGRVELNPVVKFKVPSGSVLVHFSFKTHTSCWGKLDLTQVSDNYEDFPFSKLKNGQFVKCVVLSSPSFLMDLSLRSSLVGHANNNNNHAFWEKEAVESKQLPAVDVECQGYVVSTSALGCFVRLSRFVTGRVMLKNLSRGFVSDVAKEFPVGKLVKGRVISTEFNKVELSLLAMPASFHAESCGSQVEGTVIRVISCGVLVELSPGVVGLCHYTEVFDHVPKEVEDKGDKGEGYRAVLASHFQPGTRVKCLILSVDEESRKISLGMKPSYFSGVEEEEEEIVGNDSEEKKEEDNQDDDDVEEDEEEEEEEEEEDYKATTPPPRAISLQQAMQELEVESSSAAVVTRPGTNKKESSSSDDDDEEVATRNLNPQRREALKRKAEAHTTELESRLSNRDDDDGENISSVSDFERILVANKTQSSTWIQYMSFLLSQQEPLTKVRELAKRALKNIGPQLEVEFQNVFASWLTLEVAFGDVASQNSVFADMLVQCDKKWAYLTYLSILMDSSTVVDKQARVEEVLKRAKKATKHQSKQIWLKEFDFYFSQHLPLLARNALKDCLKLHIKDTPSQIELMLAFAKREFQNGDISRGEELLERLIASHPRRVDFWNVFLDLHIKHGKEDWESVRALFQRVLSLQLSAKKMKSFFKKWLEFETVHGTDEHVDQVKQRALAYVETI